MKSNKVKAFSLIELSIVILIIGILIAGIINSSSLVRKFRLSTAESITSSSPVAGIKGLELWLETTMDDSFKSGEALDNSPITEWRDINPQSNRKLSVLPPATNSRPRYVEKGFDGFIPAVRFDGVDDFLSITGLNILSREVAVFVVAKRRAISVGTSTLSLFSSSADRDWDNSRSFVAFQEGDGTTLQTFSTQVKSTATHPGNDIAYIVETIFDGTNNTLYLNGVARPSVATNSVFEINSAFIGARQDPASKYSYNGDIAEVIVFSRALTTEDRKEIEKYLSRKYSIKIS